jgi:hypothetical protein
VIRTRGKKAGERLMIHQAANDWISATDPEGKAVIVNPTSVRLEEGEREWLLHHAGGHFNGIYDFTPDLRIVRR